MLVTACALPVKVWGGAVTGSGHKMSLALLCGCRCQQQVPWSWISQVAFNFFVGSSRVSVLEVGDYGCRGGPFLI